MSICLRLDLETSNSLGRKDADELCYEDSNGLHVITAADTDVGVSDFEVYVVKDLQAKGLDGLDGTVVSPVLSDPGRKICISMRYVLQENATVKLNFSPRTNEEEGEPILSTWLKGTGNIDTKQFSMFFPQKLRKSKATKLVLSFRAGEEALSRGEEETWFRIRSFRRCSSPDTDILFVHPDQIIIGEKRSSASDNTTTITPAPNGSDYIRLPTTNLGFGLKCPQKSFASITPVKRCYHGGVNVEEWCQCLPGFKGPTCEEPCAPHEFGADCGAVCNPIGPEDCKGIYLAAPGLPLECARGYTGMRCDTECKPGYYGPNCRLTCGHCSDNTCDRFSGKCSAPCKPGYIKDTCQDQLATMDNYPVITATGYDFVEGYIPFHGSSDSYPVFKIQYKKQQTSSWTSIFVKFDVNPTYFRIDGLDYMEKYNVLAIPIHKGGDFYRNSNPKIANFTTKCNDFSFDLIEVEAVNKNLSIQWKVSESETYPCKRIEYNLEINSAHLSKPIIIVLGKDKTKTVVDNVSLRSGTVRLKSVVPTNQTSWTDPVAFEQRIDVFKLNSLKVLSQTWGSIEFLWYSNEIKYDTLVCQSSVLLCEERKIGELKESVKPGKFKLKGLTPFTRYSCVLQKAKLAASAVTKEDLPSGPPINKADMPIKSVTNTSAVIQWTDASPCESMNGIFEGFYLELWNGDLKVFSSTESQTTFSGEFEDLTPETSYVVKVFFVNTIGNSKQFASIPFKTRSKAPDAVRELVVYKRTRSSLWLRWMPPENDSNIEKYRLALSTSGVPEKVEEFSPVPCVIWPDFVCHNVRGLVPDTQYTATVVARNSKVSYYGPPTSTKAVTRVEEAAAPENVRVVKYTNKSITLAWEIPLMLNSNPPFFVISFDQVDSNSTDEKPTLSSHKDVPINEAQRHYQLEVKELNPATTYEFTVAAGNRGNRATLNASTPPKNPPAPRTPVVQARESAAAPQIIAKGIAKSSLPVNLLSGYLVLLSTNSSTNGARDSTLAETIKEQFGGEFTVVEEFPATLDEETVVLSKKPSRKGKSSRIDNSLLEPGVTYRVAVAALSTYCNAQSATVSPVVTVIG